MSHPLVRTHPRTGKKCLFVNKFFTESVDGLEEDESKALLRVLNDVDNVLSKETKVLEELQANRFKEKKYYEIVDGDCKLEPHYQNVVIIVSVSRMHNIKILAKIHAFAKKI